MMAFSVEKIVSDLIMKQFREWGLPLVKIHFNMLPEKAF